MTAANVIAIAKAEVGYHEGRSGGSWNNIQKYSKEVPGMAWSDGQAWCQTFQSWVFMKAGHADLAPRTASCLEAVRWFKDRGRFSQYPAIGAQVFFGPGGGSHVELVYAYDKDYAYTIGGNTNDNGSAEGDGVYLKKRERRSSYTYGYGYPAYPEGIQSADPEWKNSAVAPTKEDDVEAVDVWAYKNPDLEDRDAYQILRDIDSREQTGGVDLEALAKAVVDELLKRLAG